MSNVTPMRAGIKYGLITAGVLIILSLLYYLTGIVDYDDIANSKPAVYTGWLSAVITAAGVVLAIHHFKSHNEGFLTYGQGVKIGLWTGLIIGLINALWTLIFLHVIDPTLIEAIPESHIAKMSLNENMSEEQLEASAKVVRFVTRPIVAAILTVIYAIFIGLVVSLIASIFMKNKSETRFS